MKTKLKKPEEVKALSISGYNQKLKTDVKALSVLADKQENAFFIFKSEFEFVDGVSPLLVIGFTSVWKKFVKENKWLKGANAKQTLFGLCTMEGKTVKLQIQKGKLTEARFAKAIKKNSILKRFKWEWTAALKDDDEDALLEGSKVDETDDLEIDQETLALHKSKAEELSEELTLAIKAMKAIKDKEERKQKILEIDKRADELYAIPNWEDYTPDKLEVVLHKIDKMAAQYEDPKQVNKAHAEAIVKEMVVLIKKLDTQDMVEKEQVMIELDELRDDLDDIPLWRDYTPDNIEDILETVQKELEALKAIEAKVEKKEHSYKLDIDLLQKDFYNDLESFDISEISDDLAMIQSKLGNWTKFEEKINEKPHIADVLKHQNERKELITEFEKIADVMGKVKDKLEAFDNAIDSKNQKKATDLRTEILEILK